MRAIDGTEIKEETVCDDDEASPPSISTGFPGSEHSCRIVRRGSWRARQALQRGVIWGGAQPPLEFALDFALDLPWICPGFALGLLVLDW
jgi:hypothetical protein